MNRRFPCLGAASLAAGLLFQLSTASAQETGTPRERTTGEYTKALTLQDPAELLRLGTEAYEHGYFSQCLALWPRAWESGRASEERNTREVADRAFAEWMRMLCRLGRTGELRAGLASVEGRVFRGGTAEMVQVARDSLWTMENKPGVSFRCGPHALQRILMHSGAASMWPMEIVTSESPPDGIALREVAALSAKVGMNYQMTRRVDVEAEIPVPAVVHWKLDHYGAVVKKEGSRYLLDDPTFGNGLMWVSEEALRSEGSGCFLLPPGPLPAGWVTINDKEGASIAGKGYTNGDQPGSVGPGNPKPKPKPKNPPPGKPCDDCPPKNGDGGPPDNRTPNDGMAGWEVSLMMASLEVSDVPAGYHPPFGPDIYFSVQYNQRETNQPAVLDYANFGPLWNCDWIGSLTFDSATASYNRGQGGIETFTGFDTATQSYAPGHLLSNRLMKTGATSYELRRPDGGKLVFALPNANGTRIFMTQVVDPQGNAAVLTYDATFRLMSVKDAAGQTSTFTYGTGSESLLVRKITDPFGRFATFDYDSSGRLIKITDVIGLTSEFTYAATGDVMQTLKTGYGTTTFTIGSVNSQRFVEVTHPNGDKERFEQRNGSTPGVLYSEPAALVPKGGTWFNAYLDGRNTFYWDRKAMKEAAGDYTRARMYHFMHQDLNTRSPLLESYKAPGEVRVWFNYQGQNSSGFFNAGVLGHEPSREARVLSDGSTQTWLTSFNAAGLPLSETDPLGRELTYSYGGGDLDLIECRRKTGPSSSVRLAAATYDGRHRPLTFTGADGLQLSATWNARGQLQSMTDAAGRTCTLAYNAAGYRESVNGPLAGSADSWTWTYDAFGRERTETGPDGYALTLSYDGLNRLTRLTFPDGTYEETVWQLLHPASTRDRLGRVTTYTYDALQQLREMTDPLNRTTRYEWCRCGALRAVTDAAGRRTFWKHDVAGRRTQKVYPDGTAEIYSYDTAGRLQVLTDAKGQRKVFHYALDDQLAGWSYENAGQATPAVSFAFDPWFPRLVSRTDGGGSNFFTYHPIPGTPSPGAGELATLDGPLPNDTVSYTYDNLGRVANRSIGGTAMILNYDTLSRVSSVTNALGTFTYNYDGATGRVLNIALPGGWTTAMEYFNTAGDRRLKEIRHVRPNSTLLAKYTCTWDASGRLLTWARQNDASASVTYTAGYDNADRLTSFSTTGDTRSFTYDTTDNRLTETINGVPTTANYNAVNELAQFDTPIVPPSKSYTWDAEDRLTAIDYTGTSQRTEFSYDGYDRCVRIVEKNGAAVISDRRFVWCGYERCEERDAAGGTIVRRFFPQGEQTGGQALFYFRDHLGSVRNVTDATTLRARYEYDPWGRRNRTTGDVEASAGYTGHFHHGPSGLTQAMFRNYDAATGRWISRDPLREAAGLNLYSYLHNSPLVESDRYGMDGKSGGGGGAATGSGGGSKPAYGIYETTTKDGKKEVHFVDMDGQDRPVILNTPEGYAKTGIYGFVKRLPKEMGKGYDCRAHANRAREKTRAKVNDTGIAGLGGHAEVELPTKGPNGETLSEQVNGDVNSKTFKNDDASNRFLFITRQGTFK